jgi:Flp pilus assembly protein TadD
MKKPIIILFLLIVVLSYIHGNDATAESHFDRAIADYTDAFRLDPNDTLAYNNRGLAYRQKGVVARADADFARARELGIIGNLSA